MKKKAQDRSEENLAHFWLNDRIQQRNLAIISKSRKNPKFEI